jgi:hypothetical protein
LEGGDDLRDGNDQCGGERDQRNWEHELRMAGRDEKCVDAKREYAARREQDRKCKCARRTENHLLKSVQRDNQQREIQNEKNLNLAGNPKQFPLLPKRGINFVREKQSQVEQIKVNTC